MTLKKMLKEWMTFMTIYNFERSLNLIIEINHVSGIE